MKATIVFKQNWDAINSKKYKYIINEGSSRSSKTYSLIDCYDLYCRNNVDKRLTVWRDTKTDCKKTVLVDTIKHLRKTGRFYNGIIFNVTESILKYNTGSKFEIHGTDDEEAVHGLTQDAAWLNEPYKISLETFNQIDQRTDDFIFIDWNPKKAHWIEELKKNPRTIVIHSTFKDNPFCPAEPRLKILSYQPVLFSDIVQKKLLNEQEAAIYCTDKNEKGFTSKQVKELQRCQHNEAINTAKAFSWQVYGLGQKAEKPNRIFTWKQISEKDYAQISAKTYIGCDWGTVDPFAIVEVKKYDGSLYVKELNYLSENELRGQMSLTELAQISGEEEGLVSLLFKKLGISKQVEIYCDTNRPTKISTLRKQGFKAYPATKGKILDGIDVMENATIYYTSTSLNLKYEQENYSRKVDRYGNILDEPEDMDNHLIDATRYVCNALFAAPPKAKRSATF